MLFCCVCHPKATAVLLHQQFFRTKIIYIYVFENNKKKSACPLEMPLIIELKTRHTIHSLSLLLLSAGQIHWHQIHNTITTYIWITFVYVMSTRLDALVRKSLFNVYFGWIQIEFTQCFVVIIYIYIYHIQTVEVLLYCNQKFSKRCMWVTHTKYITNPSKKLTLNRLSRGGPLFVLIADPTDFVVIANWVFKTDYWLRHLLAPFVQRTKSTEEKWLFFPLFLIRI